MYGLLFGTGSVLGLVWLGLWHLTRSLDRQRGHTDVFVIFLLSLLFLTSLSCLIAGGGGLTLAWLRP